MQSEFVSVVDALLTVGTWVLETSFCFAIVIDDERRLPPDRLERAWLPVSRDAAILAFGQIALIVHFVKTRRSLWGFVLGVVAAVASILPAYLLGLIVTTLVPELNVE